MVPLVRGPIPAVLQEKAAAWTAKFLAERQTDPSKRPDHRCYGHEQVRHQLRSMSCHKCFYCERGLTEREQEVDHHVEVAERPLDSVLLGESLPELQALQPGQEAQHDPPGHQLPRSLRARRRP